jgi:hypothetical protein
VALQITGLDVLLVIHLAVSKHESGELPTKDLEVLVTSLDFVVRPSTMHKY